MTDLSVLYLGGTGTISASCVRRSVAAGMSVYVLNRGQNARQRSLPGDFTWLQADIGDAGSVRKALGDLEFGAVANFLSFNAADAAGAVSIFRGRTRQCFRHSLHASVLFTCGRHDEGRFEISITVPPTALLPRRTHL